MVLTRVATHSMQRAAINAIVDAQSRVNQTQLQLATGREIVSPSDDPIGTQRILKLEAGLDRIAQFRENANIGSLRLSLLDNALSNATNVIQRTRELVVQAGNGTQGPESRQLIAAEVRALRDSLLAIANGQNGQGEYLFGGFRSLTQPFSSSSAGVSYNGDQGERLLQVSETQKVADGLPGSAVFLDIGTGNGLYAVSAEMANTGTGVIVPGTVVDPTAYPGSDMTIQFTSPTTYDVLDSGGAVIQSGNFTPGSSFDLPGISVRIDGEPDTGDEFVISPSVRQDLFTTLDNIATALENTEQSDSGRAQVLSALNVGLANLDQGIVHLTALRSEVGNRLTMVETQNQSNDEFELQLSAALSDIRDLDFVGAIGRLNVELAGLEAAQASYARVQGLSLFNFL